jgi:hypothetical protein
MGEDLTPLPLSMKSLKHNLQSKAFLLLEPSTHVGSIQFVFSCLCMMVLPRQTSNELQTLDYDNIPLRKVQLLSTIFDGDVLF